MTAAALSPEDVADRLAAIHDTYASSGDAQVVIADGFGCRVTVRCGALNVSDGVGEDRRERKFAKVAPPERLVIAGDGLVTTASLRWCAAQGCAVVVFDAGRVLLASSPLGRNDPRIRRAQALAPTSPAGIAAVRYVLCAKLAGQARLLRVRLGAADQAATVEDLADGVSVAESVDEARQLEAVAAALYFGAWVGHEATGLHWTARDRRRVPAHWSAFEGRRSSITGAADTNRLAERPLNALLNYCYRLAEIEARSACLRLGLDPGLGVLHLDAPAGTRSPST